MKVYTYGSNLNSCVVGDKPLKGIISIEDDKSGKYRYIYKYYIPLSEADMKKHGMVPIK